MKQYKVYLGDLQANKVKIHNLDKYGVKTNCIFIDTFELEDIPKIQKETYYYLTNKDVLQEIERLKDLCNRYEEEHNTAFKLWTQKMEEMPDYEERMKLKKEVDRLNNIIEELEKFLNEVDIVQRDRENIPNDHITIYNIILDKLKELKENNKDDN